MGALAHRHGMVRSVGLIIGSSFLGLRLVHVLHLIVRNSTPLTSHLLLSHVSLLLALLMGTTSLIVLVSLMHVILLLNLLLQVAVIRRLSVARARLYLPPLASILVHTNATLLLVLLGALLTRMTDRTHLVSASWTSLSTIHLPSLIVSTTRRHT